MGQDDEGKTIFGGKLPTPDDPSSSSESESPFSQSKEGASRVSGAEDKTIIGGALPPQAPPPNRNTATGGFQPIPPSGSGNTWLGGPVPVQPSESEIGRSAKDRQQGFFPDLPSQTQTTSPQQIPRISLDKALQAASLGNGASSNPLLAEAANLLILFGRLRTGLVEMDAGPLMEYVTREIEAFERNAISKGIDPHEAQVAKYALCGTADDIVQNLPGADRSVWIQYSMVARFFHKRDSGVGFFQEAEKAMQAPAQRYYLLELMLVCLSLGFEGQYRTMPNGLAELARIRRAIYETLRRIAPRPDEDISVSWQPVLLGRKRRFWNIPVWAIFTMSALVLVGFFATLSTIINRDGATVANHLFLMHPTDQKIALGRSAPVQAFVANSTQLERIKQALSPEISDNLVEVGLKGEYIYVRVGNLLLFPSGNADVRKDFEPLAKRIAETLEKETGPVKILGYTDSLQPSGRGRYKTNLQLSVARAEAVAEMLKRLISDPARISVEGRGAADPIGDNKTREGRALNRRVEILIAREGTY